MRLPVSLLVAEASWLAVMTDAPWTYTVLGASAIFTEELAPIFGGIAVHEGELRLMPLIVAIAFGGWIATALLYAVGRLKWETIRRRFPRTRATGTVALRVVRGNPLTASFFVRFAFGLRIVLPMASGAARVPLYVFLPVSLVGSLVWTAVFTLVGYVAGEAAVQAIGHLGTAGEIAGAVVVTIAVFAFLRWQRRRRERKSERRAMARRADAARAKDDVR
ncbi:DedA family protein [Gemmatimonas sp.]|uniref:DedA family protein n=1 Tax=Gemmatimonas sp. TaxID=1962908 RepID=UPI0027B9E2FC|nr:VTT domain-containing protein [Gemmatimonas sp.]